MAEALPDVLFSSRWLNVFHVWLLVERISLLEYVVELMS